MQQFFQDGARIEAGFRKYFHRANAKQQNDSYTLIVCHANVIRYFVCRLVNCLVAFYVLLQEEKCTKQIVLFQSTSNTSRSLATNFPESCVNNVDLNSAIWSSHATIDGRLWAYPTRTCHV